VGVTNAIALILVGAMIYQIVPAVTGIKDFMGLHVLQMQQLIKDERDDSTQREKQWEIINKMQVLQHTDREAALRLEQQTCINTAKSSYQSQKCLDTRNAGEALGDN